MFKIFLLTVRVLLISCVLSAQTDTIFNGTNYTLFSPGLWVEVEVPIISGGACDGEPEFFTFEGLEYRPVESSGRCWLDRNLGASAVTQTARSAYGDAAAYIAAEEDSFGDLYQWGRGDDGHQRRNSATRSALSTSDEPGHGDFITTSFSPNDWRNPQNNNLWQGVNGVNNPCPNGYRIPTQTELNDERLSWSSNNADGAFASPLKLPVAGSRNYEDGLISDVGTFGVYWSSSTSSSFSRYIFFNINSSNASISDALRAGGTSVRCIKG